MSQVFPLQVTRARCRNGIALTIFDDMRTIGMDLVSLLGVRYGDIGTARQLTRSCFTPPCQRWMAAWTIGGMISIAGLVITVIEFLG